MIYQSILQTLGYSLAGITTMSRDTTHGGVISIVALSSSSQTKYYADFSDEPGHPTGLAGLMSGIESLMQNFTLSGHFGAVTALNVGAIHVLSK